MMPSTISVPTMPARQHRSPKKVRPDPLHVGGKEEAKSPPASSPSQSDPEEQEAEDETAPTYGNRDIRQSRGTDDGRWTVTGVRRPAGWAVSAAVTGKVEPDFAPVRDAFAELFAHGAETGAALSVIHRGRPVVDLYGGSADAAGTRPSTADTLVNSFRPRPSRSGRPARRPPSTR